MSLSRKNLFSLLLLLLGSSCTRQPPAASLSTIEPKWLRWSSEASALCPSEAIQSHPFLPKHACLTDEGLTRAIWSGDHWKEEPRLAKKIEPISRTAWRIEIRENARWSNGNPLTAGDVAESWKQVIQRCRSYPAALETFGPVAEARAFCYGNAPFSKVGITVENAAVLQVRLTSPAPDFPLWLASPAAWPFKSGTGAGPFVISSEAAPNETRFPRNPRYWGSRPALDGVRLQNASATATHRIQSFLAGETDAVAVVAEASAAALAADGRVKYFPTRKGWFLVFSPATGPESWRRSLLQNVSPSETAALMRWPHYRLQRLTAAPEEAPVPAWAPPPAAQTASNSKEDLLEEEQHSPSLRFTESAVFNELSANLEAQWMKRLSLTSAGGSPGWLVEASWNPLHPETDLRTWLSVQGEKWGRSRTRALEEKLSVAETSEDPERKRATLESIEKELIRNQALVLPLLGAKEPALVSPRVAGLAKDALGDFDFASVDLE